MFTDKTRIFGLLVLLAHYTHTFVLLTASIDDIRKVARKFVSESVAQKIADFIAQASVQKHQLPKPISAENEQNAENLNDYVDESEIKSYKRTTKEQDVEEDNLNDGYNYDGGRHKNRKPHRSGPSLQDNIQERILQAALETGLGSEAYQQKPRRPKVLRDGKTKRKRPASRHPNQDEQNDGLSPDAPAEDQPGYNRLQTNERQDYNRPQPSERQDYNRPQPSERPEHNRPQPSERQEYNRPQPSERQDYNRPQPSERQEYNRPQPSERLEYNRPQPSERQEYNKLNERSEYNRPQPSERQEYNRLPPNERTEYNRPQKRLKFDKPFISQQKSQYLEKPKSDDVYEIVNKNPDDQYKSEETTRHMPPIMEADSQLGQVMNIADNLENRDAPPDIPTAAYDLDTPRQRHRQRNRNQERYVLQSADTAPTMVIEMSPSEPYSLEPKLTTEKENVEFDQYDNLKYHLPSDDVQGQVTGAVSKESTNWWESPLLRANDHNTTAIMAPVSKQDSTIQPQLPEANAVKE